MDPKQHAAAQQPLQGVVWPSFLNQYVHPQLQQLAEIQWRFELSAKMAAIYERLREKFAKTQNICLCQTWLGADGCDAANPNNVEVTLWADPRLAIVLDPLFQELRAKSCQGPVFFRNSMPGKVWRSGAVQIVQNLRILPPSLHPRSQLSEAALERLAEALYIPIYDLSRPAKGQVCVLEVLLSARATEAMLVADVISFIGQLLTALHLSLANPVQQPVRRSVLCGRRARAADSDGEASEDEAAAGASARQRQAGQQEQQQVRQGQQDGPGSCQQQQQQQSQQQQQQAAVRCSCSHGTNEAAGGCAAAAAAAVAAGGPTAPHTAQGEGSTRGHSGGTRAAAGCGPQIGSGAAGGKEPGPEPAPGGESTEAATPAATPAAAAAVCERCGGGPPAPACSEQPTLPATPSNEGLGCGGDTGAVSAAAAAAVIAHAGGALAGGSQGATAAAQGGAVCGGGGSGVPRKVRRVMVDGPMQRSKSVYSVAALSAGDDGDEDAEAGPGLGWAAAGGGVVRGGQQQEQQQQGQPRL